ETLGSLVQCNMLLLLDDTHRIGLAGSVRASRFIRRVAGGVPGVAAAGGQAQGHDAGEKQCEKFLFHRTINPPCSKLPPHPAGHPAARPWETGRGPQSLLFQYITLNQ